MPHPADIEGTQETSTLEKLLSFPLSCCLFAWNGADATCTWNAAASSQPCKALGGVPAVSLSPFLEKTDGRRKKQGRNVRTAGKSGPKKATREALEKQNQQNQTLPPFLQTLAKWTKPCEHHLKKTNIARRRSQHIRWQNLEDLRFSGKSNLFSALLHKIDIIRNVTILLEIIFMMFYCESCWPGRAQRN